MKGLTLKWSNVCSWCGWDVVDDLNEEHYDLPSIEETKEYRAKVKELVNSIIDKNDFSFYTEKI